METKCNPWIGINEADSKQFELWANGCTECTNLSGYQVWEGCLLLATLKPCTELCPEDHPVFDWEIAPTPDSTLILVNEDGKKVNSFSYNPSPLTAAGKSQQRVRDGDSRIVERLSNFGRINI